MRLIRYNDLTQRAECDELIVFAKADIIVSNINKQPKQIPKVLWKILSKFSIVHTPQAERIRLFSSSKIFSNVTEFFSINVLRMLKGALLLDPRLAQIKVKVVDGGQTGVDLLYMPSEKLLLLHRKWLDFRQTHEQAACELGQIRSNDDIDTHPFACDHVVEDLFELAIRDIAASMALPSAIVDPIRRAARERIRQMPRSVRVSETSNPTELEVSWIGNESGVVVDLFAESVLYNVTLHKAISCFHQYEQSLESSAGTVPVECGNISQVY